MEGLTRDSAKYIMPKEVSTITLGVIHWEKVVSRLACLASHTSLSKKVRSNLLVWHLFGTGTVLAEDTSVLDYSGKLS